MTICEYCFERVYLRVSDGHLDRFAARLDELFESRWKKMNGAKRDAGEGWWALCLYREAGRRESMERSLL